YSKLDVNYFYIDDDGVVSINRELFDKDFENINLIWHDSKNNNLLVGEIALDSQTIKISEDIRDTNIFGDESFKKLEEGNNNINIGNNNVVKSSSANNNVLICNNYNTDNINPHNYNIIIGSSDNYQNKNDNNFILGFTDKPFMSGDIEKGILKLDNINSELHMQRDIVILSDNKQLSNEFDSKEFININIGDNILGEGFNQSSGNIIIGSGNDVPNELNNSIIIGNNISDFYDVYNNSLILGNNNTDIPYIVAYNDEDNYPKEEYGTSNVVNVNGFLNLQYTNFAPTGTMVGIDADGNLCKLVSSKKYKKNIIPVLKSEQLYDFTPVLYEDINETSGNQYYGFIAEDIEKIDNKLVTYTNKDGNKELNSVSYERITVLLVAELQKQKKLIEELQSKIK
ncbi:MAG: hypothetical protein RSF67_10180, partial [Clostridia bacterium]